MGLFLDDPAPVTAAAAPLARRRTQVLSPYSVKRAIAGSAQAVTIGTLQTTPVTSPWQQDAWTGYEKVGEIHYGFDQLAKLLSRVRMFAGVVTSPADAPMEAEAAAEGKYVTTDLAQDAADALAVLAASDLPGMLRAFALCMSVPGEAYLIRLPDPQPPKVNPLDPDVEVTTFTWVVRSTDEVKVRATGVELITRRAGGIGDTRTLPKNTYIARMWRPSARHSADPDSSMVGIGDVIEELLLLSRVTRSGSRSRLNAGMIFVPDSIVIASRSSDTAADASGDFLDQLMDSMVTPITDETSAANHVPMLVTGPATEGEKIRYITFQRPFDEKQSADKERALERILQGLDIPKEIVTGLANVKYSNALVINKDLYKANIEPLALLFVDSMTQVYLRPVLRALNKGYTEADLAKIVMWYDPSEIVSDDEMAAAATEGYNLGLVSGDAWRQAHNFAKTDAPDEEELARMMVTRATTVLPEDVVTTFLQKAFADILGAKRAANLKALPTAFPPSAQDILQPDSPDVAAPVDEVPAATAASGRR